MDYVQSLCHFNKKNHLSKRLTITQLLISVYLKLIFFILFCDIAFMLMDPFCYVRFTFFIIILPSTVYSKLVITCWEIADLLALLCVMFLVFLSLTYMVSRVRCGT